MGKGTDALGYPMRGMLANDLFVSVRSSLPPVAELLAAMPQFNAAPGPVAAELTVTEEPNAPRKRFFVHEYYTRIEWRTGTHAHVETNGATGHIDWSGGANDVLRGELRIFPPGAPESVGMFLRLVTSMLLPSRRALLVHAGGVVSQGRGVIFLGDSGAGKTTTARRLGREGAMRVADDLTILHVGREQGVWVEPCRFDKGGRLPGREARGWPLAAAYDVRKGAPSTEDGGKVKDPLATWCGAILSSTGPPSLQDTLLGLAFELSRRCPPRSLQVSAAGPISSTIAAFSQPPSKLVGPAPH